MDAGKVSDDEMLQDLQMLLEGGKEVYLKYFCYKYLLYINTG